MKYAVIGGLATEYFPSFPWGGSLPSSPDTKNNIRKGKNLSDIVKGYFKTVLESSGGC